MPTLIFSVRPNAIVAEPGDIVLRTFANRSVIPTTIRLLEDQNIVLATAFHNVSVFGEDTRLTFGDEFNIVLNVAFVNADTFGATTELTVAPADQVILLDTAFVNSNTFGAATELTVAPSDEIIRLSVFTNASTFGGATFMTAAEGEGGDDYDAVADYQPAGNVPN